jgi:hypothetical protein
LARGNFQDDEDHSDEEEELKRWTILKEPETCIKIPSLQEELDRKTEATSQLPMEDEVSLNKTNTVKPEDTYLLHCKKYAKVSI